MTMTTRLKWRLGRKLYMSARGEQRYGTIHQNGESTLISRIVENVPANERLVAFDIGANQGEYTAAILAAAGPARRTPERLTVHAFEPVPSTARIFRDNLAGVPGHDCVSLHESAISDRRGMAQIAVYGAGEGTNTMHYVREGRVAETVIEVPLITLADFAEAQEIAHVHLLKIDTEGNDAAVLRGATPLLVSGAIDVVQFEYNHRWIYSRSFLKDVFEQIAGLQYLLARVDETRLTVFEDWHPELERYFQSNYALVHTRALSWLPLHRGTFDFANTYA